jgi:hypothetical protein
VDRIIEAENGYCDTVLKDSIARKRKMAFSYLGAMTRTKHKAGSGEGIVGTYVNPYRRCLLPGKGEVTTDQEILRALQKVESKENPGQEVPEVEVDRDLIAGQMHRLAERGVVVYVPDPNICLSKDDISDWTKSVIEGELGISVEQTRWLNKSTFLIITNFPHERQMLLSCTPLYFGYTMVLTVQWETDLDLDSLAKFQTTVWIDLVNLDPVLEPIAESIIQKAGKILHTLIATSLSSYANI